MKWNWQHDNWPEFEYDEIALRELNERFAIESARLIGAASIISEDQKQAFIIDLMSEEALKSSKIEGEEMNRDSVASSLLGQFGFASKYGDYHASGKEKGIAALMVDNYRTFDQPLTHAMLFRWHPCVVVGAWQIKNIGQYRSSAEPMQVVSGYEGSYKVHFEAPPANIVGAEMETFIRWFNGTAPEGRSPLPALTRAAIAHLYFVSIHPFEDGNGRIGRAICEKAIAQSLGHPALLALSHMIEAHRKEYYEMLEESNRGLSIDSWLVYFGRTMLDATSHSQKLVRFIVEKTRLYDCVRGQMNHRQEKVLRRLFSMGMDGFVGGLTASKYMKMTGALRQYATNDLQKLVSLGVLTKTGQLKGTRYWLNLGVEFDDRKREHLGTEK